MSPFISIVAWAAIIAVAVYQPFLKRVEKLGGNKKLAFFITAAAGVAVIVVPVVSLSTSMVHGATTPGSEIVNGEISLPAPPDCVQQWPLIGAVLALGYKLFGAWLDQGVGTLAELAKTE